MPAVLTNPTGRKSARKSRVRSAAALPAGTRGVNLDSAGGFLSTTVASSHVPAAVVEAFGQPRYTPEDQASNPTAQMTRVVKDVVPVGKWKAGRHESGETRFWEPSDSDLKAIVQNFRDATANKIHRPNLGKSHGQNDVIPTDELIADIDDVFEYGGRLWATSYVSPQQAVYLSNKAIKVSAGVRFNWEAGQGKKYPIYLLHVAATDNPIVGDQGPFVNLANVPPSDDLTSDDVTVDPANDPAADPEGGGDSEDPEFSQMRDLWNRSLALLGLPDLPDDVDEGNLPIVLNALLTTLEPEPDETTDDPADPNSPSYDPATAGAGTQTLAALSPALGANMPAELSNKKLTPDEVNAVLVNLANLVPTLVESNKTLTQQVADLSNTVAAFQADKLGGAKAAYESRLADLGSAGLPAVVIENFKKIGEATGYNLSNLAGLETLPGIDMSQATKRLASGAAPTVAGVTKVLSKEEVQQGIDMLLQGTPRVKEAVAA